MSVLRKTQKKPHDELISRGCDNTGDNHNVHARNDKFSQFLDDSVSNAYKRPWHRLERGLRLNRIRLFVDDEKERMKLTQVETASLLVLLQKALDKKILNSKTAVNYDIEKESILEIKGLVSHREADGYLKYQFIEKKAPSNVTMKRRPTITKTPNDNTTTE
jgi:hypothetical protein